MITVNDVRRGVMAALKKRFPGIKVYGEEIKQGLTAPCFFVKLFPVAQDREVGRRYKRMHAFDIHYFGNSNDDMHDTAESLYDCMEYIEINRSTFRGVKMRHEIVDDVLHFFVDYDFHVMRQKPKAVKMQTLKQEGYIK